MKNIDQSYSPNQSVINRVQATLGEFSDHKACWPWPKSCTKAGYGQLSTSNGSAKSVELHYAHRVSLFISIGPLPKGMYCCHKCDNPRCINPSHLFLGTPKINNLDSKRKGRNNKGAKQPLGDKHWTRKTPEKMTAKMIGERNHCAKLTVKIVKELRVSSETLAWWSERTGATCTALSNARRGKSWRSV